MPKPVQPTSLPTSVPMTRTEVAKAIAEMCGTPGWSQIFIPVLGRRRNQLLKSVLDADDLNKNFAAELSAVKILDSIINTQSNNEKMLTMLHKIADNLQ